ncbi:MAG TPA: MgtC/SapB family protein [Anaerolineaceae bacterium]|jgi:putative Mg2+ transporter-C (MgtC) family protein|nr:MgtC/SapB family protein [Anaerolineaceae bacterium]
MTEIPWYEIFLRLAVALIAGGAIGFERERDSQPAGLRTHMILALGAALVMILSINIAVEFGSDPARLAAQVVSGIGFLGAGAILRFGFNVKGLTTASTLWTTAMVGMAIGYGYYLVALFAVVIMLIVLTLVERFEKKFVRVNIMRTVVIDVHDREGILREVRKTMTKLADSIIAFNVQKSVKNKNMRLEIIARFNRSEKLEDMMEVISSIEGVRGIKIE